AFVVAVADEIAQRHHDVEDGILMGAISQNELLDVIKGCFESHFDAEDTHFLEKLHCHKGNIALFLPFVSKLIVGMLAKKIIDHSTDQLNQFIDNTGIDSREAFKEAYPKLEPSEVKSFITCPPDFEQRQREFHRFLKSRILASFDVQRMDGKGRFIIRQLFKAYVTNPGQLHDNTVASVFRIYDPNRYSRIFVNKSDLGKMRVDVGRAKMRSDTRFQVALFRAICDHIAGMTDSFALSEYSKLYG
ncbi:unnamed protein product, partial [marine sediment metagenome]